jgi:four helix bundle protein
MNNREFSKKLEIRTRKFALKIIRISSGLPNTPEARIIRNQVSKSGSSIGANYREANRGRSKADFKSKIGICESEASETLYWLEIIMESKMKNDDEIHGAYKEGEEILALFTSIGRNIKS